LLGKIAVGRLDKGRPVLQGRSRRPELSYHLTRLKPLRDPFEQTPGGGRADARHELKDAKAGDPIARVLGQPQNAQYVFDVSGL
jgi:hypothetical protein